MHAVPSRPTTWRPSRLLAIGGVAVVVAMTATACSTSSGGGGSTSDSGSKSGKTIQVVAAENFWGSIARQLGGSHVKVTSIISNPDTDPHDYEPTAADARTIASARFTIVNGIGYDTWAGKLLAVNPASGRTDLQVGTLVGLKAGGNPHQWYSHTNVYKVIDAITDDYKKIDPADAADFSTLKSTFENTTLATYNKLETDIKAEYAGTPIGASESIVSPLADSLGLRILTPYSFLKAMSEGTDVSAKDKTTIDKQIADKQIKIYVYNSQNATPDIAAQVKAAKAQHIPVATVTETLAPASDSFEQWQVRELQGIQAALAKATEK